MHHRLVPSRRAFTLLELILVLVVMAVVMGVAAPDLIGWARRSEVDGTAAEIVALMHQARERAVHESGGCRVVLDPSKRVCRLERRDPDVPGVWVPIHGESLDWPASVTVDYQLPSSTFGTDPDLGVVVFEPTGLGAVGWIQVRREDRAAYVVCLTPSELFRIVNQREFDQAIDESLFGEVDDVF